MRKMLLIALSLAFNSFDNGALGAIPTNETYSLPQSQLAPEILSHYVPLINEEIKKVFAHQDDGRTRRDTREYGYSFFKMENNDFTYSPPPSFFQELGTHICQALGHEPVEFTNIILSLYEEGFHLEPHVDVNVKDLYKNCTFYFDENVYGIVLEADPTGHLYFVKWEGEGLVPPLNLEPIYALEEYPGMIFCLQGPLRQSPYFHAVSTVSKRRISITFRTVKLITLNY
jgi:hypothetical protein